jgi:hypothetical protein
VAVEVLAEAEGATLVVVCEAVGVAGATPPETLKPTMTSSKTARPTPPPMATSFKYAKRGFSDIMLQDYPAGFGPPIRHPEGRCLTVNRAARPGCVRVKSEP